MITECPNCSKRFLVMEDLFESSQGSVRCGACMKTFKVFEHLKEYDENRSGLLIESATESSAAATSTAQTNKSSSNKILAALQANNVQRRSTKQHKAAPSGGRSASIEERQRDDGRIEPVVLGGDSQISMQHLSTQLQPDPVELSTRRRSGGERVAAALRWILGITMAGALSWVLYLQWFEVAAEDLPQNALVQSAYHQICRLIRCGPVVVSSDYVSRKLIVYSHPEQDDALIVETVIVNLGKRALPLPRLQLEFSDLQGKVVARRSFQPDEYLEGELAGKELLEPSSPIQIALQIVDPGEHAVNYTLNILASD